LIFYQASLKKTSFGIRNKEKKTASEDKTIKVLYFTASKLNIRKKLKKKQKNLSFRLTAFFISL
jgi:hypothetical protein